MRIPENSPIGRPDQHSGTRLPRETPPSEFLDNPIASDNKKDGRITIMSITKWTNENGVGWHYNEPGVLLRQNV
ncbi:MAG: hypothetical protein B7Z75_14680 [Acidocella sp. 20-57-95]|nr:MAG: hypothetical protein B7Z75_14680 [Acidocella sp. 20-57-95]